MDAHLVSLSKYLSYILRHNPASIGLRIDSQGWASVDELLMFSASAGTVFSRDNLLTVVAQNDKKRFSISADGKKIRAAQGHSIGVNLGLAPTEPPEFLYHGTAIRFLESILYEGLKPGSRQQVHLSPDKETALKVGQRHGKPVVLSIKALLMHQQGYKFVRADNGVWLTDVVPKKFIIPLE